MSGAEPTFGMMLLADLIEGHGSIGWNLELVKEQPPDGLVFRDHTGRLWGVSVHELRERP